MLTLGNWKKHADSHKRFVDNACAIWTGDTKPTHAEIVTWFFRDNPFRYEEDIEHFKEGLRIAGLDI